jgi:hypothetical protein
VRPVGMALRVVLVVCAVGLICPRPADANHFYTDYGWRDRHVNSPPVPSGHSAIVKTFGKPCNTQANDNRTLWTTADDGRTYELNYHLKLGGYGSFYGGTGSTTRSSNLNNDVRGHIRNEHLGPSIRSGVWGYKCRFVKGTKKYSTHAWGIAVDIHARYEHVGSAHHHCHTVLAGVADIWKKHGWKHGVSFGDCMHFQYATNY